QAVQPVHPLAALGWRPCGEVLVAPATQQQRLGALCLGALDLSPRLPVLTDELYKPAAVPEPLLAARVRDDAVERDVLAAHNPSHLESPCLALGVSRVLRRSRRGKVR